MVLVVRFDKQARFPAKAACGAHPSSKRILLDGGHRLPPPQKRNGGAAFFCAHGWTNRGRLSHQRSRLSSRQPHRFRRKSGAGGRGCVVASLRRNRVPELHRPSLSHRVFSKRKSEKFTIPKQCIRNRSAPPGPVPARNSTWFRAGLGLPYGYSWSTPNICPSTAAHPFHRKTINLPGDRDVCRGEGGFDPAGSSSIKS